MKKKVLFALIALFSFVGAWATDVTVGGYTVTIATQYVALTDATTGVDAPEVTAIKSGDATIGAKFICVLDANGNKVDGKIKATGTYYRLYNFTVENTQKVMKVPFCVFDPKEAEIYKQFVFDEDTYDAAKDNGGVYKAYLEKSPWSYVWHGDGSDGNCWYPTATTDEEKKAEWEQLKEDDDDDLYTHHWNALWYDYPNNDLWEDFPTFGIVKPTSGSGIVAVYQNGAYFGKIDFNAENAPKFFLASVEDFWPARAGGYTLPWPGEPTYEAPASLAEAYGEFDSDYMMFYQVPALEGSVETATDLSEATVTIDCTPLPYNGDVQYPAFSGANFNATVTYTPATTGEAITLVEGRDFTPVYEVAGDDYKSTGDHDFTVNFFGAYAGSKDAEYNIAKAHVNINLAYIYKTYGEADPALPANATPAQLAAYTNKLGFEIDASTPLKGTDVKSDIAKYLVFKRATGDQNQGENVQEYEYYYDRAANVDECNYTFSFLQTKSLLIIQPKAVTIDVIPTYKKYHKNVTLGYVVNDDATTADVVEGLKAQLADADKDKATGTPGAGDIIKSISWAGAGTKDGEAVNADLNAQGKPEFRDQGTGYPFIVESNSANYTVTVATPTGFAIVPTDEADITVEVPANEANGAVDGKFIYKGAAWEPEPDVYDGGKTNGVKLTKNVDYTVAYDKNVDAGNNTAICKVTLIGSYTSAETINQNFTISKAELVVKPKSATAEGNYTVLYDTFVDADLNGDTPAATAARLYTETADHAYFSVNPADITVKKGGVVEQDVYKLEIVLPGAATGITAKNYEVTIGDALLALNDKPILTVRPVRNQSKVYDGNDLTEDELAALQIDVFNTTENRDATAAEIAALKILGTPVYEFTKAEGANVGRYRLEVNGPTVLEGYTVEYNNNHGTNSSRNYRITHKDVTITPGNYSMTYGHSAELETMEATVAGLVSPDTPESLGITNPDFYYVGIQNASYNDGVWTLNNEAVGTRNINVTVRNLDNGQQYRTLGNYHVRAVNPGTLTINKADLIITANPQEKQVGDDDPELTVTISGAKTGDNVSGFYTVARPDKGTEAGEAKGDHDIVVTITDAGNNAANYNVSKIDGKLTIGAISFTVKANDQYIHYGEDINENDVVITLKNGSTLRWQKAGINEDTDATAAREANNAKVAAFGKLEVLDGKKAIGANKNAYRFVPNDKNENIDAAGFDATEDFTNGYLTVYPLTRIPLDMENLAQVLEDHKGLEGITVVMPARKMEADEWYSWVLPFDIKASDMLDKYVDGQIVKRWGYSAMEILDKTKSKKGNVVFALQMSTIKANTPFIAKVENTIEADDMKKIEFPVVIPAKDADGNEIFYYDYTATPAKAVNPSSSATDGSVSFIGLYAPKTGIDATEWILNREKDAEGNLSERKFLSGPNANVKLTQTRAYLKFGDTTLSAKARIYIEEEDGTLTEITGVEAGTEVTYGEGWYTINGIKLEGEPTTTGTYIFNGKKVFIQK